MALSKIVVPAKLLVINYYLLVIGVVLLLLAVGTEHFWVEEVYQNDVHAYVTESRAAAKAGDRQIVLAPERTVWGRFAVLALGEFGVAFIVAFGVSAWIDRRARERDFIDAEERRRLIAEDVVLGVYGLQHKPSYVRKVIETALQPTVVRSYLDLSFTLRELTQEEVAHLGVEAGRFLVLHTVASYTFSNIASSPSKLDVRYSVSIRHAQKLKDFSCVKSMSINGVALDNEAIKAGLCDEEGNEKQYAWPQEIGPNGTLSVVAEAISIKEMSDNEVWGSYYPTTDGLSLRYRVLAGMRFGVRSLAASPCNPGFVSNEECFGDWKVDGAILPLDSIVAWWRVPEDEGHEETGTGL